MSYPEHEKDLYEIYRSEVTGEAMFNVLCTLSWSQPRREKWRALAALETQTRERYLKYLEGDDRTAPFPLLAKIGGGFFGLVFCLLPWSAAMKGLLSGTPPLLKVFERLAAKADEADCALFTREP